MHSLAASVFRLTCALLAGAQLFFSLVASQVVFPPEVAALPKGDPRRTLAADLVGQMLARLDAATLIGCALAVGCAVYVSLSGAPLLRALPPLLAGLCAVASAFYTTPGIQALRASGDTSGRAFGLLHAASGLLLVAEMLLLTWAALAGVDARPKRD